MPSEHCQVFFGTKTREEANFIVDILLDKKLIACADSFAIDAKYRWKGKIVAEQRYQIIGYSIFKNKDQIIREIKKVHTDEVPSIVFTQIDANKEYLDWIESSINY